MVPNARFLFAVAVLLHIGLVSCAQYKGCEFEIPYHMMVKPVPEATPIHLGVNFNIIGLREITNAGGSFGIDVEYVHIYFLNIALSIKLTFAGLP